MARYRNALPQLAGGIYLADAGPETDLIFNHGIDIPEFALHTLLPDPKARTAVADYFRGFLSLAREMEAGFILDSATWKAHMHWAHDLGATEAELRRANEESIDFIAGLRDEFSSNARPIVLNGIIGPRSDAYAPDVDISPDEAEAYHGRQISWLAETEADMITAATIPQSGEAVGFVRAAEAAGMPAVVSFVVETDGKLSIGEPLADAVRRVDDETSGAAAYFMVNCAHPDHFFDVLEDNDWCRRIRGLRCNASRKSHAELDNSETLDDGNPEELGGQYKEICARLPWLNIFGGCCGSDLRHVTAIARALAA
jgi:homocysteine S-methyltransferase